MSNAILIADCGSTSCEWRLIEDGKISALPATRGFNPTYEPAENLKAELDLFEEFSEIKNRVASIFYYGAGCTSELSQNKVHIALGEKFTRAEIEVKSDLWAAARAVFTGQPVICGILGTGSNACRFDGENLEFAVPSLGYILGDEGSGNHIGRLLLNAYFYGEMPIELRESFAEQFELELDVVLRNTYREGNASGYLANFAVFAGDRQRDPFIRDLIAPSMRAYLTHFVKGFAEYNQLPLFLVGSVAHYFREIIGEECTSLGINLDTILRRPVDRLAAYHQRIA